jgi:hypothetical protein
MQADRWLAQEFAPWMAEGTPVRKSMWSCEARISSKVFEKNHNHMIFKEGQPCFGLGNEVWFQEQARSRNLQNKVTKSSQEIPRLCRNLRQTLNSA